MKLHLPLLLAGIVFLMAAAARAQPAETPPAAPAAPDRAQPPEEITVYGRAYRDKIIHQFVFSYAQPVQTLAGQLARWKAGICPVTAGLSPSFNDFVTNRVKEVAGLVGAPVDKKPNCKTNLVILFSMEPQKVMDTARVKSPWILGSHYKAQEKELATVRHPVQSWYVTGTEDYNGTLSLDDIGDITNQCDTGFGFQVSICAVAKGSRTSIGFRSEFLAVTVLIDSNKVVGAPLGALADDIAMLALAQTKSFDGCRELVSITNLMSPNCDANRKAEALTLNDIAYLRGLYQMNPELSSGLQQLNLASWMRRNLDRAGGP